MNVEIGTAAAQFLFWEYLLKIFGNGSLQCREIELLISLLVVACMVPLVKSICVLTLTWNNKLHYQNVCSLLYFYFCCPQANNDVKHEVLNLYYILKDRGLLRSVE